MPPVPCQGTLVIHSPPGSARLKNPPEVLLGRQRQERTGRSPYPELHPTRSSPGLLNRALFGDVVNLGAEGREVDKALKLQHPWPLRGSLSLYLPCLTAPPNPDSTMQGSFLPRCPLPLPLPAASLPAPCPPFLFLDQDPTFCSILRDT